MSQREKKRKEEELLDACRDGRLEEVKHLLREGTDPLCQDSDGWTPLHLASAYGQLEVMKFLVIEKNVDPNVKATDARTPLHFASLYGRLDIVKYLVSNLKCDPKVTDQSRRTALDLASLGPTKFIRKIQTASEREQVVEYLKGLPEKPPVSSGEPPRITTHPVDHENAVDTVSFTVQGTGAVPLSYRWEHKLFNEGGDWQPLSDGSDGIKGGNTATLTITGLKKENEGTYRCYVTNPHGTDHSHPANLILGILTTTLDGDYTAYLYTASSPSVRNERVALYTLCRHDSLMNTREFLERKLREKLPDSVIDPPTEVEVTFSSSDTSTLILPQPAGWTLSDPERYPPVQNSLQITKNEADSLESPTILLTMTLKEESEAEPEEEIALQMEGFSQEHELLWKLFSQEELDKRRQELLTAFTNAMGKNHKMRFAHLLFFGLPGAGKSTLIKCLMGKVIDYAKRMESGDEATNKSTGVCDKPIPAVIEATLADYTAHALAIQTGTQSGTQTGSQTATWRHLHEVLDELFQLLSDLCGPKAEAVGEQDGRKKDDVKRTKPSPSISKGGETKHPFIPTSASVDTPTIPMKGESLRPSPHQLEKREELRRMVDDAVSKKKLIQAEKYIDRTWTVYLTDTGGQLEFQEFFTVLGHGPSLYILLFRLDQPLNKTFTITYRHQNGKKFKYQSQLTVKEILLQSLASIDCLGKDVKVLILSTHKDLVSDPHAKLCEVDTELWKSPLVKKLVLSHPCQHGDCAKQGNTHVVMAVNNYCKMEGVDETGDDIVHVQRVIERYISKYLSDISQPASWFIFGMAVRHNQKSRVLSYDYCKSLATKCGIKSEDFEKVLSFLHNEIGLIRHFKDVPEMKDIIVQDPQAIFDKITTLVTETFGCPGELTEDARIQRKRGIFTLKDVANECSADTSKGDELLTPEKLVALLQHLRIITALKKKPKLAGEGVPQRYFMPCVMYHSEETTHSDAPCEMQKAPGIPPLLFTFDCGYTPKGMFGALVTHIEAEESDWSLELEETFKNKVYFTVGRDMVFLKHTSTHLEVTLYVSDGDDDDCTRQCTEIYKVIEGGLEKVAAKLQYINVKPVPAFYCCGKHTAPQPPHLAKKEMDSKGTFFRCVLNRRGTKCSEIEGCEKWWSDAEKRSSEQPQPTQVEKKAGEEVRRGLDIKPTMYDLKFKYKVISEVAAEWADLAYALRFEPSTVNTIEADIKKVEDKCTDVLNRWLVGKSEQKPIWDTLLKALDDIKRTELAEKIRQNLYM